MGEYLREAVEGDMDLLFQWANEAEVRKNSFSSAQIPYEEHRQWFLDLLKDTSRRQYIYMEDHVPIGQIRVTVQEGRAEVGYSIGKEWRGRGHGKKMLALLQRQILADEPDVDVLVAKVKEGNRPSQRAFLNAGYCPAYTVFELQLLQSY